jgi:hypothetical protein
MIVSVSICAAGPAYAISAEKTLTLPQVVFCLLAALVVAASEFGTLRSLIPGLSHPVTHGTISQRPVS